MLALSVNYTRIYVTRWSNTGLKVSTNPAAMRFCTPTTIYTRCALSFTFVVFFLFLEKIYVAAKDVVHALNIGFESLNPFSPKKTRTGRKFGS